LERSNKPWDAQKFLGGQVAFSLLEISKEIGGYLQALRRKRLDSLPGLAS
jgi:hypothetical protein